VTLHWAPRLGCTTAPPQSSLTRVGPSPEQRQYHVRACGPIGIQRPGPAPVPRPCSAWRSPGRPRRRAVTRTSADTTPRPAAWLACSGLAQRLPRVRADGSCWHSILAVAQQHHSTESRTAVTLLDGGLPSGYWCVFSWCQIRNAAKGQPFTPHWPPACLPG